MYLFASFVHFSIIKYIQLHIWHIYKHMHVHMLLQLFLFFINKYFRCEERKPVLMAAFKIIMQLNCLLIIIANGC